MVVVVFDGREDGDCGGGGGVRLVLRRREPTMRTEELFECTLSMLGREPSALCRLTFDGALPLLLLLLVLVLPRFECDTGDRERLRERVRERLRSTLKPPVDR